MKKSTLIGIIGILLIAALAGVTYLLFYEKQANREMQEEFKLEKEDLKQLDEMERNLKDYLQKIEIMEKKYEESINNYFGNFIYFLQLLKEITDTFA